MMQQSGFIIPPAEYWPKDCIQPSLEIETISLSDEVEKKKTADGEQGLDGLNNVPYESRLTVADSR
jgi:hypothetical protein